jgi:hypothetical protein
MGDLLQFPQKKEPASGGSGAEKPRGQEKKIPPPQGSQKVKYRISRDEAILMVGVAFFFDALNALFGLIDGGTISGFLINSFSRAIFVFWFWMKGISLTKNPKMLTSFILGVIVGYIPFLDLLPETAAMIWRMIVVSRAEDVLNHAKEKASEKVKPESKNRENQTSEKSSSEGLERAPTVRVFPNEPVPVRNTLPHNARKAA